MKFNKEDNDRILKKLLELKNLFQFGEKVVPMIQSLTTFIEEVIPLLQNVNFSINESSQKMPIAKNQIDNVTNATELATTEILDLIDAAGLNIDAIQNSCTSYENKLIAQKDNINKLFSLVKGNTEAESLINEISELAKDDSDFISIKDNLTQLNDHNFQVTLSLQVQDITSQQLAAVNHLISSVHEKLDKLVEDFDKSKITTEMSNINNRLFFETNNGQKTFDENASYAKDDRQLKANEIIDTHKSTANSTQDDIDKLFSSFK